MKRLVGILLGLALAAVCLWLVFRGVEDPARLRDSVFSADVFLLSLLVASVVAHIALRALRWRALLGRHDAPFVELFAAVTIGYMASLLPARVGEVIRPTLLARRTRVPLGTAIATVGAERIALDLPAILLFLGLALALPGEWTGLAVDTDPAKLAPLRAGGLVALGLAVGGLAVAVALGRHGAAADRRLARWTDGPAHGPLARAAGLVARALRSLIPGVESFGRPATLARLLAESLVLWSVVAAGLHAGIAACGVPLAPLAGLLIVPVTAIGIATGTPGGAGTYQLAMMLVLHELFRAPRDPSIAAGLVVHVVQIVPVLLIGLFFLARGWLAPARAAEAARAAESHAPLAETAE